MYKNFIKRIVDIIVSFIAIIIFSPVILLLIIILFINNKGNPFFTQRRPGKDEKIFPIIKFRTMTNQKDIQGKLLPDADRLTPVGKMIRKTSLDELPQLLNVLTGSMSLIGPRPLLPEYLPLYSGDQKRRHQVKPGITGWAQVNGRNTITWTKKFEYDLWYIDNLSFLLDIKILFMTAMKVIMSKDISATNHVTSEEFNGKN